MSLPDAKARMNAAHRDMLKAWFNVSQVWRDDLSRTFEERSVLPLDKQLRAAMNALDSMNDVLNRVRSECSDDSQR